MMMMMILRHAAPYQQISYDWFESHWFRKRPALACQPVARAWF